MNRFKPGDKARVKEYRFDISILTETETDPDELILSIIQAVKADGRSIAASPIPNPPNKDYPIQREPIEPVQEEESKVDLQKLEDRFKTLFENETEESFNIWLCSRLEGAKRPAIEDYMVNLETAGDEYYASPNLFRYTQAVDNYVDNLLSTISRLKSEIEELKRKA